MLGPARADVPFGVHDKDGCSIRVVEEGSVVGPGCHFHICRLIPCSSVIAAKVAMAIAIGDSGRHGEGDSGTERQSYGNYNSYLDSWLR